MKYAIIIPDGAADEPLSQLGGKTPIEAASTPNMDWVASHGRQGLARTVPDGFAHVEYRADLERLLSALPEREREIERLRFLEDLTQSQIADRVGLSQMQVSRILRSAVAELEERARAVLSGYAYR